MVAELIPAQTLCEIYECARFTIVSCHVVKEGVCKIYECVVTIQCLLCAFVRYVDIISCIDNTYVVVCIVALHSNSTACCVLYIPILYTDSL